jgi:hypothetical protein
MDLIRRKWLVRMICRHDNTAKRQRYSLRSLRWQHSRFSWTNPEKATTAKRRRRMAERLIQPLSASLQLAAEFRSAGDVPSRAVSVWLAIDDADTENGCMTFIAGSHHHGHLTYRESESGDHSVLDQVVEDPEQYGSEVIDELKAGQISIHSDLLLHGSDANNSDRRRCGLTLRYAAAEVRAGLGWNAKGVVVRGQDVHGHWANPPRPTAE